MKIITLKNIKSLLNYNLCYKCGNKRNLHECNNCLELYCTTCDLLINNWCNVCKYNLL
jgi:hypothetical protein